jgi:CRP/FNR family transcriptional regulator
MLPEFAGASVSHELESALRAIATSRVFPRGAALFQQGETADGFYLLEQGSVRILLEASDNISQLLDEAGPGSLLGLSDSMAGEAYRTTAEASIETSAGFVDRKQFVEFLAARHEFCMEIVRLLSANLHLLYHKFRSVSAHPGRPRRRSLHEAC